MSLAEAKPDFHRVSETFLANRERTGWHDATLWWVRAKRDKQAAATPDWEPLRDHAAAIKAHVLDHLPALVTKFSANARARGWQVHFAADGAELCQITERLLSAAGVRRLV